MLPIDYGPSSDPHDGVGRAAHRVGLGRAVPRRALGVEDGLAAPEARYERRESVELAFVAALQHLPATQRAVLILRDVLGFSAREVAESLDTTVASVNSALQRARKTVDERFPSRASRPRCARSATSSCSESSRATWTRWSAATSTRSSRMLAEDAAWSMPPLAALVQRAGADPRLPGDRAAVGRVPLAPPARRASTASRRVAAYSWVEAEQAYLPFALDVLTFEGDRIKEITSFISRSTRQPRSRVLRALPRPAARLRQRLGVRALRPARPVD